MLLCENNLQVITLDHVCLCSLVAAGLLFPVLPCLCPTTNFVESFCGLCISFLKAHCISQPNIYAFNNITVSCKSVF